MNRIPSPHLPFSHHEYTKLRKLKDSGVEIQAEQNQAIFKSNGRTYTIRLKTGRPDANVTALSKNDWEVIANKVILMLEKKNLLGQSHELTKINQSGISLQNSHKVKLIPHEAGAKKRSTVKNYSELASFISQKIFLPQRSAAVAPFPEDFDEAGASQDDIAPVGDQNVPKEQEENLSAASQAAENLPDGLDEPQSEDRVATQDAPQEEVPFDSQAADNLLDGLDEPQGEDLVVAPRGMGSPFGDFQVASPASYLTHLRREAIFAHDESGNSIVSLPQSLVHMAFRDLAIGVAARSMLRNGLQSSQQSRSSRAKRLKSKKNQALVPSRQPQIGFKLYQQAMAYLRLQAAAQREMLPAFTHLPLQITYTPAQLQQLKGALRAHARFLRFEPSSSKIRPSKFYAQHTLQMLKNFNALERMTQARQRALPSNRIQIEVIEEEAEQPKAAAKASVSRPLPRPLQGAVTSFNYRPFNFQKPPVLRQALAQRPIIKPVQKPNQNSLAGGLTAAVFGAGAVYVAKRAMGKIFKRG
jgi:hypothetical protein